MAKRLTTLLAALLVLGFVVAGCGDDENDGSGSGDTAAETAATTDATTADDTPTGEGGTETEGTDTESGTETEEETETEGADTDGDSNSNGGAAAPSATVKQAVENCKRSITRTPRLSEETKSDLEKICEKAASGDQDAVREASRELCVKVVEDMLPEGSPGRQAALDGCKRKGQ